MCVPVNIFLKNS